MTYIDIPGRIANQLRQGLTLKMGEAAQALEQASLGDRRERTDQTFRQYFEQIDAYRDVIDVLGYEDESDPLDVAIDLDPHREAVDAGLAEAASILRGFTKDGSSEDRAQAGADLAEVEDFAVTLRCSS